MNQDIAVLREAVGKLTQMLAGMGLRVTQMGTGAFVEADPKTNKPTRVNIPYIPDNASPDLIMAIQGFVDHEVAHILFSDFSLAVKAAKIHPDFHSVVNMLEDTRIEREMGRKFPGALDNIDRLSGFFIERISHPAYVSVKGDDAKEFNVLLMPLIRAWSGQRRYKEYLDQINGWSNPLVKFLVDNIPKTVLERIPLLASTQEAYDVGAIIDSIVRPAKPKAPPSAPPKGKSEEKDPSGSPESCAKSESPETSKKPEPEPEAAEDEVEDEVKPAGADADNENEEGVDDEADSEDEGGTESEPEPESESDDEEAEKPSKPEEKPEPKAEDEEGDESTGEADDAESDESDGGPVDGEEGDDDASLGTTADGDTDESEEGESTAASAGEGDGEGNEVNGEAGEGEPQAPDIGGSPFTGEELDLSDASFDDAIAKRITQESDESARDAEYLLYTKDFDKMEPAPVSPRYRDAWLQGLDDKTRHMVGPMQKDIERMMAARSQVVKVPGFRSGRLHSGALHKLPAGDDRVFRRKMDNPSVETAVCLLIDNSGSMRGSPIQTAMAAGYALSQTLERVKIQHEVVGFTTCDAPAGLSAEVVLAEQTRIGRHYSRVAPLYMPVYKGFDERFTSDVRRRFASTYVDYNFMANNIDGEAVELAVQRLQRRRERRKVLLVLSDGYPAGDGWYDNTLRVHLKKVVEDAAKVRVEVIGIGIMSEAVKDFYPKHFVLQDVDSLPGAVMGELKRVLLA